MKSGVYSIYCKVTDKYYVGQSLDIEERVNHHLSRLRNNKHKNELLQSDYNKYGEDAFIIKVEKYIEPQFLNSLETHFMEFYNSINNGYNINNTKVIIRKEDKDRQLAIQTLKYIDELEELYLTINVRDVKVVLLNYFNMCMVEALYVDEDNPTVLSNSLNHYVNRSLTYDNSAICRYEVLFSDYVCRSLNGKYPAIKVEGCEVIKPTTTDVDYSSKYVGYINNLLMLNTVRVGLTYNCEATGESYYKELNLVFNDNGMEMMWNVKKSLNERRGI